MKIEFRNSKNAIANDEKIIDVLNGEIASLQTSYSERVCNIHQCYEILKEAKDKVLKAFEDAELAENTFFESNNIGDCIA